MVINCKREFVETSSGVHIDSLKIYHTNWGYKNIQVRTIVYFQYANISHMEIINPNRSTDLLKKVQIHFEDIP